MGIPQNTRSFAVGANSRARGLNNSAAFAESDARKSFTLAPAAHDHFVAVFEELSLFAGGEADGFRAAPRQLQQRSARFSRCSRHSPAGEQITRPQIAAAAGVMRDHLRNSPIEVLRVAQREPVLRQALGLHRFGHERNFELDIVSAARLVARIQQVRQWRRIAINEQ